MTTPTPKKTNWFMEGFRKAAAERKMRKSIKAEQERPERERKEAEKLARVEKMIAKEKSARERKEKKLADELYELRRQERIQESYRLESSPERVYAREMNDRYQAEEEDRQLGQMYKNRAYAEAVTKRGYGGGRKTRRKNKSKSKGKGKKQTRRR
jgi:hypothetical protein